MDGLWPQAVGQGAAQAQRQLVALARQALAFGVGGANGFFELPDTMCSAAQIVVRGAELLKLVAQFNHYLTGFEIGKPLALGGDDCLQSADFVELGNDLSGRNGCTAALGPP